MYWCTAKTGRIVLLLLLGLPSLATWLAMEPLSGFPSNDDPFYGRPAQIFAEEGRYRVIRQSGELSASSVLHAVLGGTAGWLFGFSYRILFLVVIIQLWLAAIAIYALSRAAGLDVAASWFLAAIFSFNPLVFGHGFTFMTDGPAMAWATWALFLFDRGLRMSRMRWLWLGSILAGAAFWMRQTHVVVIGYPIAVLSFSCFYQRDFKSWFSSVFACTLPAMASVLLFECGWIVFGDDSRVHTILTEELNHWQLLINIYGLALLVGFLLLPVMPWLAQDFRKHCKQWGLKFNQWPATAVVTMLTSSALMVPLVLTQGRAVLTSATGTFIQNAHLGPIFLSDFEVPGRWSDMGDVVWPSWVWQSLSLLGILNIGLLSGRFWTCIRSWWKPSEAQLSDASITFGLAAVACPILGVILSVRTGVLDRYWMLLVPIVFMMLAVMLAGSQIASRFVRRLCLALLIAQLAFSIVMVRDFLVWNQTRWIQFERWLADGYTPRDIDGGRDMNAWYRSAEDYETLPRPGDTSGWWSGHAKLAMSIGPRDGWTEISRLKWYSWATGAEHEILILQRNSQ